MTAAPETSRPRAGAGDARRLAVHFSSVTAEWTTPPAVLTRVVQCLGAIDLDPCADGGRTVPAALVGIGVPVDRFVASSGPVATIYRPVMAMDGAAQE